MMTVYENKLREFAARYGKLVYEGDHALIYCNDGAYTTIPRSLFAGEACAPDGTPVSDLLQSIEELQAEAQGHYRVLSAIRHAMETKHYRASPMLRTRVLGLIKGNEKP